ncbi:complex I intermediate-associated protein-like protein 84 [Westerdykella ornata]|uniref:Complex I intermediate-associated protein-like protein 84 n=1 Tax=Westerdykella ornata TaxID=318751 RepID=A0A6A6JFM0_WESOR|nr:complex I intermediate-associated protein-like protein 84 [Westerdykella ornata]KAF2273989.1 complex I intermediate-associated protein-like protein 84 [Westerdykella ornata]
MPSQLTRVVFRSIIANKPLLYRGCLQRSTVPRIVLQNGFRWPVVTSQRRTFLNIFKQERKVKPAELLPGLDTLAEVARAQQTSARAPPPSEVAAAFKEFFPLKGRRCEDFHIIIAGDAFRYLQGSPRDNGSPWLSTKDIVKVFKSLEKPPKTGGGPHLELAKLLNDELRKRCEVKRELGSSEAVSANELPDQPQFFAILTLYGATSEARDLATSLYRPSQSETFARLSCIATVWTAILRGFVRENNEEELLRTAELMSTLSIPFVADMQSVLVTFFGERGNLAQAKHWYSQPVTSLADGIEAEPHGSTYAAILKVCALGDDLSFGQQVVASLLKQLPDKPSWDAIFVWSAAIGKGVDEVNRMMDVMVRRNNEARQKDFSVPVIQPDIDTINALVEFSISKRDPYTAERYIALAEKRGILLNAKTFTMQMQYRLAAKDVDGAKAAYYGLQGSEDESSVAVTNELIRAMCNSKQQTFDDIMSIVDDLHQRKSWLEPETVAALCTLHLRRGEGQDALDLMQVHVHLYSPSQREVVRDALVNFTLDRRNSTADAWHTYQMTRKIFPETPRSVRLRLMEEFFARERSDMACHVFFHMRFHTHELIRADSDVYVAAFAGFAKFKDAESLELVVNQLKLDLTVELDTRMRNALMLAHSAVGNNRRAFELWADIVNSKEGPTYNSIAIAFKICEGMPWGDERAKALWRRLKQMDVDIDKRIFVAYLRAIANNFRHDEARALVEHAEEEYGFTPDLDMLGNWYNATINIEKQKRVEDWIKQHYPAVWTELERLGHEVTMEGFGYRQYHLPYDLEP